MLSFVIIGLIWGAHCIRATEDVPAENPPQKPDNAVFPAGAIGRLGTSRFRQTGVITAMAVDHAGNLLATGGEDHSVFIWDAQTGRELHHLIGFEQTVACLAFRPGDKQLIAVDRDGKLRVFDVQTGDLVSLIQLHCDTWGAALSPDLQTVAGGIEDHESIVSCATGEEVVPLKRCLKDCQDVRFGPFGKILMISSNGPTLAVDAKTGAPLRLFSTAGGILVCTAFSADAQRFARVNDKGKLEQWRLDTWQKVSFAPADQSVVNYACFSPNLGDDADLLVSSSQKKELILYSLATGTIIFKQPVYATMAVWSPDGTKIYTAVESGVMVLDAKTGKRLPVADGPLGFVNALAYSSDGTQLHAACSEGSTQTWDLKTGMLAKTESDPVGDAFVAGFSADAAQRVTGSQSGLLQVWDRAKPMVLMESSRFLSAVRISHDGRHVLSTANGGEICWWDTANGKTLWQPYKVLKGINWCAIALSPDEQYFAIVGDTSPKDVVHVAVGRTQDGSVIQTLTEDDNGFYTVAFSSDGKLVATGGWKGSIHIADIAQGKQIETLAISSKVIVRLQFFDHDAGVIAGSGNGDIFVLRRGDADRPGKVVQIFHGNGGTVSSMCISPDGTTLAAGYANSTILLWKLR